MTSTKNIYLNAVSGYEIYKYEIYIFHPDCTNLHPEGKHRLSHTPSAIRILEFQNHTTTSPNRSLPDTPNCACLCPERVDSTAEK